MPSVPLKSASEHDRRFDELRALFTAELDERVRAIGETLLRLERAGDAPPDARKELFDALFREAHSLKGASRMVHLEHVERLAHTLETALAGARRLGAVPPPAWFDALYRTADAFQLLNRAGPAAEPPADLESLITTLADPALLEQPSLPSSSSPPSPPSAPPDTAPADTPPVETPSPRPATAATPATLPTAATSLAAESVRVSTTKLDTLLSQAGELTVTEIRVAERLTELRDLHGHLEAWLRASRTTRGHAQPAAGPTAAERPAWLVERVAQIAARLRDDTAQLGLVAGAIRDEVMTARLLPVSTITHALDRAVRDLARSTGKEVGLVVDGADTEIDRKILDQLQDPLLHMVRNAVDHGVEPPAQREASGKPRAGTITVSARQVGDTVRLEVSDDGAGLDPAVLRDAAVRKGLLTAAQAAALDEAAARELIFLPGFSSREDVTATSGRGVGLDVVREHVERLQGQVTVTTTRGGGTRFVLDVPLTLATTRAILVEQGGQVFAVPTSHVERSGRVEQSRLTRVQGKLTLPLDGRPVQAVDLAHVLGRPSSAPTDAASRRGNGTRWHTYFVLGHATRKVAILADALVGEQEIVVKSLGWPLRRVRNVAGTTLLGSGQIVVILNPADLLQTALGTGGAAPAAPPAEGAPAAAARERTARILVVDDSLTTRTLERTILESAGYDVAVAADGLDALRALREGEIDLVVSDIEMPRLDGFGLTAEIRRDERLRHVPVILVTSLDAREHRERGVEVGADAYVVKSAFEQGHLLDTIGRLL